MRAYLLLVTCLALVISPQTAVYADAERSIERLVELRFVPESVLLFVIDGSSVTAIPAQFAPLPNPTISPDKYVNWLVAGRLPNTVNTSAGKVEVAALVESKESEHEFFPPLAVEVPGQIPNVSELRAKLLARKHVLDSWQVQLKVQGDALRRLRDDADTIANFGRIIEAQDELSRSQSEFDNLGRDIENLQKFLVLIKNFPEPRNFSRREGELTRQLAMLSEVAKKSESSQDQRAASSEGEMQRKIEIVEATRDEDLDALQRRLFELRRTRARRTHEADSEYGNQRVE